MTVRFVIACCSLALAGCATERTAPIEAPTAPTAAATPETAEAPVRQPVQADTALAQAPDTAPALEPAPAPSAATSTPSAVTAVAAAPTSPADKPAAGAAAADSPSAPAAAQPAPDTLDFTALGERLRATKAIGVLTKLSVKNQADDLLAQFRDYYQRQGTVTLPDLRRSYDTLVLNLLSLLKDGDPPLATDIDRSRAAIWDILSDQRKFIDSHLMAGASR